MAIVVENSLVSVTPAHRHAHRIKIHTGERKSGIDFSEECNTMNYD
jgi:hypothetical protein